MSDRVVVIFGGRIAQIGGPTDIYERPETLEVARFVGQVNLIEGTVLSVANGRAQVASVFGRVSLADRGMARPGMRVLLALRPESLSLAPAGGEGAAGTVTARYYSGSLIDYRVRLASGETIHVQTFPNTRCAEGETVTAQAAADSLWLIGPAP